ncbi:hypothetical protein MKQ70_24970 [Chitinophaga sedimenti]|uniref:hypothetical protein n=1 Tax=Chitinophaga sedimenti TaxID=2033606 RepID=UPI002005519A|nr:hypothetical protein [Chitinophaga sedimenti]MCK7558079.1 hypothetical protein [Chitinophaga sedimenti]
MNILRKAALSLLLISQAMAGAQAQQISVLANKPGAPIQSTMWGIFLKTSTSPRTVACTPKW